MTKLLLLIFFTSFFSADRGIDWFYIQEGRVWHHQGEILTFPVDASSNLPYVSQYTQLGECEMCPYRSVFKNTIDTLLIEVGMINDFGDAEVEKSTLFYMNENLLIENGEREWRINSEPIKNGLESVRYNDVYDYYNKKLAWEVNYSNGLKHGLSTGRYIDGELKWIVNYKNGRKEGDDKRYHGSGELKSVVNYIDGLKQGEEKRYHGSGTLMSIVNFVDDLKQGEKKSYYPSGALMFSVDYIDGLKQGIERRYSESGLLISSIDYLDNLSANDYSLNGYEDFETGKFSAAIIDYTKSIELNPNNNNAENFLFRAMSKEALGNFTEAVDDFNIAIDLDPKNANIYIERATLKNKLKDYSGAINDYNKAHELNPNAADSHYRSAGELAERSAEQSEILDELNIAIALESNKPHYYTARGNIKIWSKDYSGAINDYNKAIDINPNQTLSYYLRGKAKGSLGDYTALLSDFDKVIELGAKKREREIYSGEQVAYDMNANIDYSFYESRARAKVHFEDYSGAIEDYKKALQDHPFLFDQYKSKALMVCKVVRKAEDLGIDVGELIKACD